jgi:hypothetical protein
LKFDGPLSLLSPQSHVRIGKIVIDDLADRVVLSLLCYLSVALAQVQREDVGDEMFATLEEPEQLNPEGSEPGATCNSNLTDLGFNNFDCG